MSFFVQRLFTALRWGPVSNQEDEDTASFITPDETDTSDKEDLPDIMDDQDKPEEESEDSIKSEALEGIQAG